MHAVLHHHELVAGWKQGRHPTHSTLLTVKSRRAHQSRVSGLLTRMANMQIPGHRPPPVIIRSSSAATAASRSAATEPSPLLVQVWQKALKVVAPESLSIEEPRSV